MYCLFFGKFCYKQNWLLCSILTRVLKCALEIKWDLHLMSMLNIYEYIHDVLLYIQQVLILCIGYIGDTKYWGLYVWKSILKTPKKFQKCMQCPKDLKLYNLFHSVGLDRFLWNFIWLVIVPGNSFSWTLNICYSFWYDCCV